MLVAEHFSGLMPTRCSLGLCLFYSTQLVFCSRRTATALIVITFRPQSLAVMIQLVQANKVEVNLGAKKRPEEH